MPFRVAGTVLFSLLSVPFREINAVSRNVYRFAQAAKAEGGSNVPEFFLCAALEGHKGDVRSLAVGAHHLYSGARDNAVMAWELDEVLVEGLNA